MCSVSLCCMAFDPVYVRPVFTYQGVGGRDLPIFVLGYKPTPTSTHPWFVTTLLFNLFKCLTLAVDTAGRPGAHSQFAEQKGLSDFFQLFVMSPLFTCAYS